MTEIAVRDWSAAVAWYTSILGLELLLKDEAHHFALLGGGTARLALKGDPRSEQTSSTVRLIFRVDDLLSECTRLVAAGVEVGPVEEIARENYHAARLYGPEGTAITLFAWTPQPPHGA